MNNQTDFDYSRHTPLDSTGRDVSIFKSSFKNIRFALSFNSTFTVTAGNMCNLPGIAFQIYGDVSLWRALLAYNGLQDPIQDIQPGVVLKIPKKQDIIAYLSAQQNSEAPTITI